MADSTVVAMRKLVRQYTHSFSPDQLSDAEIDEKLNVSLLYDFPNILRLFSLRTTLEFFTQPGVGTYSTTDTDPADPLFNFKNRYLAVHQPVYMAGVQAYYTQWTDAFYAQWPLTNALVNTGLVGDGTTGPYTGILDAHPVMQDAVIITGLDVTGTGMILVDYPTGNVNGYLAPPNTPQAILPSPYGSINYLTGAFTAIFPNSVDVGVPIIAETIPYQPGKPNAMLYYDTTFTIRPIPDKVYSVTVQVDKRPLDFIADNDVPDLEQWFQFIAIVASKKIFETRMDFNSVALLMQLYREQMLLCGRTTLTQATEKSSQTIYKNRNVGPGWWNNATWPY